MPSIPHVPVVQAPATIQVNGGVYDTTFRPLAGATVTVVDGSQAGLSATTDVQGHYRLTGEFNDATQFLATHEGYVDLVQPLNACTGCGRVGTTVYTAFYLSVPEPPLDISGDYTLTFTADSACTGIPQEFRTRTFAATITPATITWYPLVANTYFLGVVSGGTFLNNLRSFEAAVAGDLVALELVDYEMVEQVAPNTYLRFAGRAEASAGRALSSVSTSFQGRIDYCALMYPMAFEYSCGLGAVARVDCQSADHRVTIAKR